MKKRLKALLMALVMMVTTIISINGNYKLAKADDGITVVFHFSTSDNKFVDENGYIPQLYYWTIGDGVANDMTVSGNEATYTLHESASTLKIGYLVRWGNNWDHKDYDSDRYIDVSAYISGTVDVYITSGVGEVRIDDSKATKGIKLVSASTEDLNTITFKSAIDITDISTLGIKVKNTMDNVYEDITNINGSGTTFTITMANKLDNMKSYEIEYLDGRVFMVALPDLYSNDEFEGKYTYTGNDLGATWSAEKTDFRVWAPLATKVSINLYKSGTAGSDDLIADPVEMTAGVNGTWVASVSGDLNGVYYTYSATVNGKVVNDVIDPYAVTAGVNGNRGMILDLDSTDPEGWENDANPTDTSVNYVDDILYELHIRDFSIDASSGMKNKGKYLAFTEKGTVNSYGQSTGIDYLKDLGITHVHLLPTFDYASVDESKLDTPQFNWGYDPQNFNIPEGSYSSDPYDGAVRVNEFKQMVQSLHNAGMSVVMDVVYGHVNSSSSFSINLLTPNYYTRPNSSASGCGNDTATERAMNRKYIVDSVVYWATEYHVDGFRIDQEGLFDVDTINAMVDALHAIDPSIIVYGEGWDMSSTNTTKDVKLASQVAAEFIPGGAYFSDGVRDALKGSVFDKGPGYITGGFTKLDAVLGAIIANPGWQWNPNQVVNYNSCHDNYTLFDRITITEGNEDTSFDKRVKQNNLAAGIIFTSQGIPFIQAGEEILRSKPNGDGTYEENSYSSSDAVNSIKWDTLNEAAYSTTYNYYKGLIAFRKAHAGLRMSKETDIDNNIEFLLEGKADDSAIAYMIKGDANGEASDGLVVIYNPSDAAVNVALPEGEWGIYVQDEKAGNTELGKATGSVSVNATSCTILVKGNRVNPDGSINDKVNSDKKDDNAGIVQTGDSSTRAIMFMVVGVIALAILAVIAVKRKKEFN